MPFPNVYALGTINYGVENGSTMICAFQFVQQSNFSVDQAAANQLATGMNNQYGAALLAALPAEAHYYGCTVLVNDSGLTYQATNTDDASVGSVPGESLPPYAAAVIQKRTNVPGRAGRGRWYVGCVPEGWQEQGYLVGGGQDGYAALATAWKTNISTTAGTWRSSMMSRLNTTILPITDVRAVYVLKRMSRRLLRRPV